MHLHLVLPTKLIWVIGHLRSKLSILAMYYDKIYPKTCDSMLGCILKIVRKNHEYNVHRRNISDGIIVLSHMKLAYWFKRGCHLKQLSKEMGCAKHTYCKRLLFNCQASQTSLKEQEIQIHNQKHYKPLKTASWFPYQSLHSIVGCENLARI